LTQTGKIQHFPVVLFGKQYWAGLEKWLSDPVLREGKVSTEDLDLFVVCDDPSDAVDHILKVLARRPGEDPRREPHVQPHKQDAQ
jgi:predicted Rossmann-fold nucleotide-binding protein